MSPSSPSPTAGRTLSALPFFQMSVRPAGRSSLSGDMRPSTADSIEADGDDASDFTMDETSTTDTASVVSDVRRY